MSTVIFDMDGVLADSSRLTVQIISGLLAPLSGCPGSQPDRICETFGMSIDDMWEYLMPGYPKGMQKQMSDAYEEQIAEALAGSEVLLPGVPEALAELKESGFRLTVASNCGISYMNAVLDSQDIRRFFTDPQCLESVRGSEKADILRHHMARGFGPWVMAGDRRSDVQAAHKAGIPCIGIISAFTGQSELDEAEVQIQTIRELPAAVRMIILS